MVHLLRVFDAPQERLALYRLAVIALDLSKGLSGEHDQLTRGEAGVDGDRVASWPLPEGNERDGDVEPHRLNTLRGRRERLLRFLPLVLRALA
jgi:hypothetical protein